MTDFSRTTIIAIGESIAMNIIKNVSLTVTERPSRPDDATHVFDITMTWLTPKTDSKENINKMAAVLGVPPLK